MPLTKSSFKRLVENRPKDEVWIVMLHTDSNFLSKKLHPKFIEASSLAGGMFRFGVIDTKAQPLLARSFNIKTQPSYIVFHQNGQSEYTGNGEPEDIIGFMSKYLEDDTKSVDEKWLSSKKAQAILFTEKKETPLLWVGLSHVFKKKNVKIGVCKDPSLIKMFKIEKIPQIMFYNSTHSVSYSGKIEFAEIKRVFEDFAEGRYKIESKNTSAIMKSSMFTEECIGGLKTCVLHTKNELDEGFAELKKKYSIMDYKWFYGTDNLPWEFLKNQQYCIYNPKIDGFRFIDKLTNLGPELERVFGATVEWIRRYDLMKDEI